MPSPCFRTFVRIYDMHGGRVFIFTIVKTDVFIELALAQKLTDIVANLVRAFRFTVKVVSVKFVFLQFPSKFI